MDEELRNRIKRECIEGLITDGGHHKQYNLEEILKLLGYDLKVVSKELCNDEVEDEDPIEYWEEYNNDGYWWEKGIPG